MNIVDRIKYAISHYGYSYDGKYVIGKRGEIITGKCQGYIACKIRVDGITFQFKGHQFAFYYVYGYLPKIIDHINGVKDDNTISNLRDATSQVNSFNRLNVKGYSKTYNNFQSRIVVDGKKIYLGHYNTEDEAHKAYLDAKNKYHK